MAREHWKRRISYIVAYQPKSQSSTIRRVQLTVSFFAAVFRMKIGQQSLHSSSCHWAFEESKESQELRQEASRRGRFSRTGVSSTGIVQLY